MGRSSRTSAAAVAVPACIAVVLAAPAAGRIPPPIEDGDVPVPLLLKPKPKIRVCRPAGLVSFAEVTAAGGYLPRLACRTHVSR